MNSTSQLERLITRSALGALLCVAAGPLGAYGQSGSTSVSGPVSTPRDKTNFQTQKAQGGSNARKADDPDAALQQAVREAGNDQVTLVRKLQGYLTRFPDGPRNAAVYRALVEGCEQLKDETCALESAEKLIALRPDDSDMMLVAVHLLEQGNDSHGLTRANGYLTRIIDRVEKAPPDPTPGSESSMNWQTTQDRLRAVLYATRGGIEERQKKYTDAAKDFSTSNKIIPSATAEQHLGSIAEMQRDLPEAVRRYLRAFVLPEESAAGTVDRAAIRQNLGNVWRQVRGSDVGLSDAILEEFDRTQSAAAVAATAAANEGGGKGAPARQTGKNRDARDVFGFTLRDLEGGTLAMSQQRGRTVVLSFWATWCMPSVALEPLLAHVASEYSGRQDVIFLSIDTDANESVVKPFVSSRGWTVPVVFADGLDEFFRVLTLPTVIVVDRSGKVDYRVNGYQSEDFEERLTAAIEKVSRH